MKLTDEKLKALLNMFGDSELEALTITSKTGGEFRAATVYEESGKVIFNLQFKADTFKSWQEFFSAVLWSRKGVPVPDDFKDFTPMQRILWIKEHSYK